MQIPEGFTPTEWARVEAALAQRNLAGLTSAGLWVAALASAVLGEAAMACVCFFGGALAFSVGPGRLPPDLDAKLKKAIEAGLI